MFLSLLLKVRTDNNIIRRQTADLFFKAFSKEISEEDLTEEISVSNFLTKEKIIEKEKEYLVRVSSINRDLINKLIDIFFKRILSNLPFETPSGNITVKEFVIDKKNYEQSFNSMDIEHIDFRKSCNFRILSPILTEKVSKAFLLQPSLDLVKKLSEIYSLDMDFKDFSLENIKIISDRLSGREVLRYNKKYMELKGDFTLTLEKITEENLRIFNLLFWYLSYKGLGSHCSKGWGQIKQITP